MTHGSPDWGQFDPIKTVYRVTDLGELAARLNVTQCFSRSGTVLWWDDFEDNINKWVVDPSGAGAAAELSTDKARSGGKSAKLTTGDEANDDTSLCRYMGIPPASSKMGFEISFVLHISVEFMIYIYVYYNSSLYLAGIRTNWPNNKVEYYNESAAWADLLTTFPINVDPIWTTWKLIMDFSGDGEYIKLIQNADDQDVSGKYCRKVSTSNADVVYIFLVATAKAAANNSIYVDDFVLTYNEP